MKKHLFEFVRRGFISAGFGPIVLAVLYLILYHEGVLESLTVKQVSLGIFSVMILAFLAGGINAIYQIERLPLMVAILIHGSILYIGYLGTYVINDWLEWKTIPILVFSAIFVFGYLVIWAVIYFIMKRRTEKINEMLKKKQQCENS